MPPQNFENHTQRVPGFLALGLVLFLVIIGAGVNLYQSIGDHQRLYSASLILVIAFAVFFTALFARVFALKAQDRGIRAEENLRHFVLTGKLLDPRLTINQIIALRFASDAEFPALVEKALSDSLSANSIKLAVKHWRADTHRV